MRVCVLGSGSAGNCTYVEAGGNAILIDAGLSAKQITDRIAQAGGDVGRLRGICISHEHSDHVAGLRVMVKKYGLPVFANAGTVSGLQGKEDLGGLSWNLFTTGHAFTIGNLRIEPFSVPHDAYDPVGFVVEHVEHYIGVVTDMGMVTGLIRERLKRCQAVVIESNHDEKMLQDAERPWSLKQRIFGRQGHLSNQGALSLLQDIAGPHLQHVFLAHLSEDCNRHDLALETIQRGLANCGHPQIRVSLTYPDRISHVYEFNGVGVA